jgi:hypothetical protein
MQDDPWGTHASGLTHIEAREYLYAHIARAIAKKKKDNRTPNPTSPRMSAEVN